MHKKRKEEWLMTAEEIEIIVTAKIEEALKEFNKIVPAVKEKIWMRWKLKRLKKRKIDGGIYFAL